MMRPLMSFGDEISRISSQKIHRFSMFAKGLAAAHDVVDGARSRHRGAIE